MFFIFSFIFARSLVIDGVDSLHHYSVKRDLLQCQKRPTTVSKETYYRSVVIDGVDSLHHCSKSSLQVQESLRYAKTGKSVKRDLILSQKRPT